MAVLGTAIHRAIDDTASDLNIGGIHIGNVIEHRSRIAGTTTKDIAVEGVTLDQVVRTRHADSTATDGDGSLATHVGGFVGAIHVVEDVTTLDDHLGVTPNFA